LSIDNFPLIGLWGKRFLVFNFALMNIKIKFKGTYLGLLWTAVEPLLLFVLLYVVFTGMRARLAFSTAIQINPDIMLIDEILSVGDYTFRQKSYEVFYSFRKNKKTILYVSHNLESLPKLCDRVLLLHHGKMVMLGDPKEVIEKYKEIASKERFF